MIELAKYIDHTNLKPTATAIEIERLCEEAVSWRFQTVCVNSGNVPVAAALLKGTQVGLCSVVGFPLGASLTEVKVFEAQRARDAGASEIDMVLNIAWLQQGYDELVFGEIRDVVRAVPDCAVKVIIEASLLDDGQKVRACEIIKRSGAAFAKTSTGFSNGGAAVADIRLMRQTLGSDFGVKASGGIRDYAAAIAMLDAGATRLGTSASVAICEQAKGL